jgi:fatty acid desaturase
MLAFVPIYIFYGFQMQCMGFAGGHELLHGSAFRTRWLNTLATFFVSTAFFEVLYHERINHKQHHKYTLDIDR